MREFQRGFQGTKVFDHVDLLFVGAAVYLHLLAELKAVVIAEVQHHLSSFRGFAQSGGCHRGLHHDCFA
jgi:hypothetical protein